MKSPSQEDILSQARTFQEHLAEGKRLYLIEQERKAIEKYNLVLELNPNCIEAYYYKGLAVLGLNKQEAKACYLKAIELRPDHPAAYYGMSQLLLQDREIQEAIAYYEKANNLKHIDSCSYESRGLTCTNMGKITEGIKSFDEATRIDPSNAYAHLNKGIILNDLNDVQSKEAAIESCNLAISIEPGYNDAYLIKGMALEDIGQATDALECYEQVLINDPNNIYGQQAITALLGYSVD